MESDASGIKPDDLDEEVEALLGKPSAAHKEASKQGG